MARRSEKTPPSSKKHLDELLDEALDETFPASDPPALTAPAPASTPPKRRDAGRGPAMTPPARGR